MIEAEGSHVTWVVEVWGDADEQEPAAGLYGPFTDEAAARAYGEAVFPRLGPFQRVLVHRVHPVMSGPDAFAKEG